MGNRMISISFNIELPAQIVKEGDVYVSLCPALDVASQGDTIEEAKRNLVEAITAFMISCHERGVLDAVLKQCGFVPNYNHKETTDVTDFEYINVPLPFMIDLEKPNRCHA